MFLFIGYYLSKMAEGGNEDLANLDAASIHSDASTEILYLGEDSGIPVVDLVTPPTSPDSRVYSVSPASSIYSDLIDSDGESVSDPSMLDELDYDLSIASLLNVSVEDRIVYKGYLPSMSLSSSCFNEIFTQ